MADKNGAAECDKHPAAGQHPERGADMEMVSDKPAELPAAREDDHRTLYDLQELYDIIIEKLREHVPPDNRTRFDMGNLAWRMTSENGDVKGDVKNRPNASQLREAIKMFRGLPEKEQRAVLNGWDPDVLEIDRGHHERMVAGNMLYPCLRLEKGRHHNADDPVADFWATTSDDIRSVQLMIGAGATKAEVLDGLAWLTRQIDRYWDRLIANPMKLSPEEWAEEKLLRKQERQEAQ